MTLSSSPELFDDLDDPSPPVPAVVHRVEVVRRLRRFRRRRHAVIGCVAATLAVVGSTVAVIGATTPAPVRAALDTSASARHNQSSTRPHNQAFTRPTNTTNTTNTPSPYGTSSHGSSAPQASSLQQATSGSRAASASSGASALPPAPVPPPCPAHSTRPSWQTGRYCGPAPHAGNGLGPNGECSGFETAPPCGPGVVVGRYYTYTLPGRCDGRIVFDGRLWDSELPPPTNGPDQYVWMRLDASGGLGFISPEGAVGFTPDTGQPPPSCGGTSDASGSSGSVPAPTG